jgi:hypothetical protein
MANGDLRSLKLFDYSDRELLQVVNDLCEASADGWTTSEDIAKQIGITTTTVTIDGKQKESHPVQMAGSRMAALKRFGAVYRDDDRPSKAYWRLTPVGEAMAFGKASKAQQRALEEAEPESLLVLTRMLAQRQRGANESARHLVRREWMRETQYRS